MPNLSEEFIKFMSLMALRDLNDMDLLQVEDWLNKDYVKLWYDEPEEWLLEIQGRKTEFSWIHHMIAEEDGLPIGFCQYYDCYDAKDIEDCYNIEIPNETFSIDYLIGEEDNLNKGGGKQIVALLTQLIFDKGNVKRIIVKPESENVQSIGVLLTNGYCFNNDKKYYVKKSK